MDKYLGESAISELIQLTKKEIDSKMFCDITATAYSSDWIDGTQTIEDENIISDGKYIYILDLNSSSIPDYEGGSIWADDVSEQGKMTIHTNGGQETDIVFDILRVQIKESSETILSSNVISGIIGMADGSSGIVKPTNISITKPPKKLQYYAGDSFDPEAMVVYVTYSDGSSAEIFEYTYAPSGPIPYGTNEIKISYTESGVTVTTKQEISVIREVLNIPVQDGTLTYNKSSQNAIFKNYDSTKMTISGETYGTNANTYTATFTLNSPRYEWSDGSTETKSVQWVISRKKILNTPIQSVTLTYNKQVQTPTFYYYNDSQLVISGSTTELDAGTYIAKFTPTENYEWEDGTVSARDVEWTIEKATATITPSLWYVSLTSSNPTATLTITRPGDGEVFASYNPSHISVTLNDKTGPSPTMTITGVSTGNASVAIWALEGKNYKATQTINVSVNVSITPAKKTLEQSTWDEIREIAKSGLASDHWQIGDTKSVTYFGETYYVQIIGFDHDEVMVGSDYGREYAGITFQFGVGNDPTKNGMLPDQDPMNSTETNSRGWRGSRMRNTTLGNYLAEIGFTSNDVTRVFKYTSEGDGSSEIDATNDYVFLLSEVEVFGKNILYSDYGEGKQYKFYENGNSPKRYKNGNGSMWWLRSPAMDSPYIYFCHVDGEGKSTYGAAIAELGVSFAFCL